MLLATIPEVSEGMDKGLGRLSAGRSEPMESTYKLPARSSSKLLACSAALTIFFSPLQAKSADDPRLVYLANFGHGSLESSVDHLGIGPVKPGNSQIPNVNINATVEPGEGSVILGVTRPANYVGGPIASGVFATPVEFGPGSIFSARVTLRAPTGPQLAGNQFAAALNARTGDEDDLQSEARVAATFRVRGTTAALNVFGASVPPNLPNIPQDVYDAIFDAEDPEPFTLELVLDRKTGVGTATLTSGGYSISHNFQSVFRADSGPVVTSIGPTIAVSNGPGQRGTVEVMEFRISTSRQNGTTPADCGPEYQGFACRVFPGG